MPGNILPHSIAITITDGNRHSLSKYADSEAVRVNVLMVWCPAVQLPFMRQLGDIHIHQKTQFVTAGAKSILSLQVDDGQRVWWDVTLNPPIVSAGHKEYHL